jgi:hypothetical protein
MSRIATITLSEGEVRRIIQVFNKRLFDDNYVNEDMRARDERTRNRFADLEFEQVFD